jgi:hypothetical protein
MQWLHNRIRLPRRDDPWILGPREIITFPGRLSHRLLCSVTEAARVTVWGMVPYA